MNRKKLLAQHTHCVALANMHVDELAYRLELNHPESVTSAYLGSIQSYLAEQDQIVQQLSHLGDQDKADQ